MKIVALLMAFLVLALSVMPCADETMSEHKATSEISNTTDHHNHDDDACSPFCHCACCAGFSINHVIASISVNSCYNINSTCSFLPAAVVGVELPVWQPPQIV